MSYNKILLLLGTAFVVVGCASDVDREWMKVNTPYTAAEFRRDYAECDKTGKLDECLRSRGWVSVTTPSASKQAAPDMRTGPGMSQPAAGPRRY